MYSVQNRMKRMWSVPPIFNSENRTVHQSVDIAPGMSGLVAEDHWQAVRKGNRVIEALETMRHIVVTGAGKEKAVDAEELANPKPPTPPAELTDKDERVQIDSKVEVKEVVLEDGPKEGRGPGRPRKEG